MGVMRAETAASQSLDLVAKRLRDDGVALVAEELPRRWVDLLLYLDEQEQRTASLSSRSITKP